MQTAPTPFAPVFLYPISGALVLIPLSSLSLHAAAAVFLGVGFGALAFVVTKRSLWRLLLLGSASSFAALSSAQWSPLLVASAVAWPFLGLAAAKPNLALPLLLFQSRFAAIVAASLGAAFLLLAGFIVEPHWLQSWISNLRNHPAAAQYHAPIATILGAPMILAAAKWRRPEARLLLGMACVPQNGFFYDQLPIILVAEHPVEIFSAVALSWIAQISSSSAAISGAVRVSDHAFPFMIGGLYLPALIMVLRRPNVGELPLPRWVRRARAKDLARKSVAVRD
jgi:hypothetical protein